MIVSMSGIDMNAISRSLNAVTSVGQERAAINAAIATGQAVLQDVSNAAVNQTFWDLFVPVSGGDSQQVVTDATVLQSALDNLPDDDNEAVGGEWADNRAIITNLYVTASGLEGTLGSAPTVGDAASILGNAIENAPTVILQSLQTAASALGNSANWTLSGILSILWNLIKPIWPWLVAAGVVLSFVFVPELGAWVIRGVRGALA